MKDNRRKYIEINTDTFTDSNVIHIHGYQSYKIIYIRDRRGGDRMVVENTTICAISAYHH